MLFSKFASGAALDLEVISPMYPTQTYGDMPLLDVSSSYDTEKGRNVLFIVNRNQTEDVPVEIHWQDIKPNRISSAYQLTGKDPKAFNSFENPNNIVAIPIDIPDIDEGTASMMLPVLSFTVLELEL